MNTTKQAFSVLADNHPGVLLRMAGLFSRRGFNIDSIVACKTENPAVSRLTVVVTGDEGIFSQVIRQLFKLEEIIKVEMLSLDECTASEMLLVKVKTDDANNRTELLKLVQAYGGRVLDIGEKTVTVELTGESAELDGFVLGVESFGICEMSRSGVTVLQRGDATIHDYTI
ncbi:MAG: acetolactate synthase small subunit [Clostridia bacterium]|nr:acetolactate synthase small subunit [Clostridia bacterium]